MLRGEWGLGLGASLLVAGILSCGDPADPPIDPTEQVAALESVAGSDQQAEVGTALDSALVVRAVDASGDPVPGATISWSVSAGTIEPESSTADTVGEARAEWRMGEVAGTDTAIAAVGDARVEWVAIARPGAAANVSLEPSELVLDALGARERIHAVAHDRYGNSVTEGLEWVSTDTSVARVDAEGWVVAMANGPARVTVRASEAVDTTAVLVEQVVSELRVQPAGVVLDGVGATHRFAAQAVDRLGAPVGNPATADWSVSNTAVAQIDSDGSLMARRDGQVAVTARVGDLEAHGLATIVVTGAEPRSAWGLYSSLTDADLALGGTRSDNILLVSSVGQVFRYDGADLRRMNTSITDADLTGVWMASPSDAFAVGLYPETWEGRAFHYDGTSWREMTLPAEANHLSSVWGTGPDDVWAVSSGSDIIHYDGSRWTMHVDYLDNTIGPADVWGSAADDVYAVLSSNILHYDGDEWTRMEKWSSGSFRSIWGAGPDDVYAAGGEFDQTTLLLHYDGSEWTPVEEMSGLDGRFETIGGSGPTDIYLAGRRGHPNVGSIAFHYDGSTWTEITTAVDEGYRFGDAWTAPSGQVFLSGPRGAFMRANATDVASIHYENTPLLGGVWGSSESDVFAVGDNGRILHYNGSVWNEMTSGTGADLTDVWGTGPENVFAAGADGTVLHFDGAGWAPLPPPREEEVFAIWGLAENKVFAAVAEGDYHEAPHFCHYDGREWSRSPVLLPEGIADMVIQVRAFWGFAPDDLYAVGIADQLGDCHNCSWSDPTAAVFHYDGRDWRLAWTGGQEERLMDIWGSSSDNLWAVGWANGRRDPFVVRFDGTEWRTLDLPLPQDGRDVLTAVWGTGPQDVYVGGESDGNGLLLHYDGHGWTELTTGSGNPISGLWGPAVGPMWAVTGSRFNGGGSILQGRPN